VLSLEEVKQRFAHLRPGAPGYPWA
jgi:hypothetical protein